MTEGKRQIQVGKLIQTELSSIFLKQGLNTIERGMVSISHVEITPDLLEARVYLSFLNVDEPQNGISIFKQKTGEIRRELGNRLRHQLRRIPELQFILDDTLDRVFRMEEIFKKLNENK